MERKRARRAEDYHGLAIVGEGVFSAQKVGRIRSSTTQNQQHKEEEEAGWG